MNALTYITLLVNILYVQSSNSLPHMTYYQNANSVVVKTSKIVTKSQGKWTAKGNNNSGCAGTHFSNGHEIICIKESSCTFTSQTYNIPEVSTNILNIKTNFHPVNKTHDDSSMRLHIKLYYKNGKNETKKIEALSTRGSYSVDGNPAHKIKSFKLELIIDRFCGAGEHYITLFYYQCNIDQSTANKHNVIFPSRVNATGNRIEGKCITNGIFANNANKPYMTCFSNGTFIVNYGDRCVCGKGFRYQDGQCTKNQSTPVTTLSTTNAEITGVSTAVTTLSTTLSTTKAKTTEISTSTTQASSETPPNKPSESNKYRMVIIIGSAVGGIVVLILILVIVFVCKRPFASQFDVSRMEDGTMQMERKKLFTMSRIYVDPTTYSQVDDAVHDFTLEINRKYISTDHMLGGGEFANVFKGILSTPDRNSDVAIKVMKPGASKSDRDDFLSEAAILGQFSDPNVITIEGVVLKDHPNMIVLEYMSNGSLDKYLVKNDSQLSIQQLLGMSRAVSSGMKYLSGLGYIHRDLAARNVLINSEGVCKIADFGMSRELKTNDTYDTKGGRIPIKWTAPEAIEFKKFTTASDVWSYGVLLWEIFSFGERPYWEWSNMEVLERLSTGYRLPPPMECPKVIHNLMLQCWHRDRTKRLRFNVIFDKLEEWLKKPELLTEIASVITRRDEDLDYSVMEDLSSWLEAIKMQQYLKVFTESGYTTPKDVLYLTNEDLQGLGITILGHRKKLLKAIRNTRLQAEDDGLRTRSSSESTTESKLSRTTSFGLNNSLSKKVSFLANPHASISLKRSLGKRTSGYKLT